MSQPGGQWNWLIDDLLTRVPTIRHAAVLSIDGLLIAASAQLSQEDAERLAAVASGLLAVARAAGDHFEIGGVRQTILEMESAYIFVTAAGPSACLAALTELTTDIGVVAYEMEMMATRAGTTVAPGYLPVATDLDPR